VAQTLGNTSPNNSNKKVTVPTLIKKMGQKVRWYPLIQLSMSMLDIKMMPILTKLLLISMEANNVFGWSSRVTIRLYAGCFLVRSRLMSLKVSEKNAISDPASKNDSIKRMTTKNMSTVIAAGAIAKR
jgi:hypothetical protein